MLDPLFIGLAAMKGLQACLKAYNRTDPKDESTVICKSGGKFDLVDAETLKNQGLLETKSDVDKLLYNLADMEDYLLKTDILLKLCSDINDLNKLYRKSFKKIETYDEEEECTVTPETCNGYTFELYINSFF